MFPELLICYAIFSDGTRKVSYYHDAHARHCYWRNAKRQRRDVIYFDFVQPTIFSELLIARVTPRNRRLPVDMMDTFINCFEQGDPIAAIFMSVLSRHI